jgi:hypothetical protein
MPEACEMSLHSEREGKSLRALLEEGATGYPLAGVPVNVKQLAQRARGEVSSGFARRGGDVSPGKLIGRAKWLNLK